MQQALPGASVLHRRYSGQALAQGARPVAITYTCDGKVPSP